MGEAYLSGNITLENSLKTRLILEAKFEDDPLQSRGTEKNEKVDTRKLS